MRISLEEAFIRDCRKLTAEDNGAIFEIIVNLRSILASPSTHSGRGLRKIHPTGLWEVRIGLAQRALFRMSRSEVVFTMVGTHDEVKRYGRSL